MGSMALNSLTCYRYQIYMSSKSILDHNVGAGQLRIFLWLGGLASFSLLGAEGLHAGEAKPSWPVKRFGVRQTLWIFWAASPSPKTVVERFHGGNSGLLANSSASFSKPLLNTAGP